MQSIRGKVRMRKPQHEIWILEYFFLLEEHGHTNNYACTDTPRQLFIALKLVSGQGHIREISSLKKGRCRGLASMDAEIPLRWKTWIAYALEML